MDPSVLISQLPQGGLYDPAHGEMRGLIIMFHGGGLVAGQPQDLNDFTLQLNKLGLTVFRPAYRTLSKGGTPEDAISDGILAVKHISSHFEVNKKPIALIGASAGSLSFP